MKIASLFGLCCMAAEISLSATMLFDFEGEEGLASFQKCNHYTLKLSQAKGISATGESSLKITTKKWVKGMNRWPALNLVPSIQDWTPYDRLAVTLMNPAPENFYFGLFLIGEKKKSIHENFHYRFQVPYAGHQQYIIPLVFPKGASPKKIERVHFHFSDPGQDITLYVDSIALLKKGEQPPEQSKAIAFVDSLLQPTLLETSNRLDRVRADFLTAATSANEKSLAENLTAKIGKRITDSARVFQQKKTLANYRDFREILQSYDTELTWFRSFQAFLKKCAEEKVPTDQPILLGQAPSFRQVHPHEEFQIDPVKIFQIDLARNEKESRQLVLLPNRSTPIRKITLSTSDLKGPNGATLSAKQIDCDLMGYVKATEIPPYNHNGHARWWPDPILDFIPSFDLPTETTHSYWIRVRAPKDQPAGIYRGALTLHAEGITAQTLPFEVRVRDFTLPDKSPLPLAITFSPNHHPQPETLKLQREWQKDPEYPMNIWKRKKLEWADFLADYWITFDSLYHSGKIDFDLLLHLKKQNRLGMFNLRYWHYFGKTEASRANWKKVQLDVIKKNYLRAQSLGILDHAYIYGCDETKEEFFPQIREATRLIREACPGVPIMTTATDRSYGVDSPLDVIDAFCPLTPKYDPAKAQKAREAGKQVWWYICCGPHHPYANIFIEYPSIEARLLMGAMTAKFRPDGFLYYQTSIWNSRRPITQGPFTNWDPRSWTTYNGDGSWTCVGPEGKPVPTQRLENFRDGLEDYAYVLELERRYAIAPQEAVVWRAKARAAISVPGNLVQDLKTYSHDESRLVEWRKNLADLIETAPVQEGSRN